MTFASEFGKAFNQSREALDDLLKNGPLLTDELKTWDNDLKQFIVYQGIVRDNPGKTFTKAKLFPNEFTMHSRSPPPIITLDGDQGPPPLPNREPEKTRPPPPNSPPPKMPPKPIPPKAASLIPNLHPPPKTIQPKLGAVAKTRTVSKPRLADSESPQKTDTDTPTEKAARESTKHLSRSLPRRKTSLESMSSPSEEESAEDLRDRLTDRRNYRASLGSGCKQAKRYVTVHSGFDQITTTKSLPRTTSKIRQLGLWTQLF